MSTSEGTTLRVQAVIPARFASQRLPGKPIADVCGKPMVQHVYERTARATLVNDVYVATDDERIASAVRAFGGKVIMTPPELSTGTDRVAYACRELPAAEIIVNVQGDEPLLEPAMVDEAVEPLLHDDRVEVSTLVRRIEHPGDLTNPGIVKVVMDANNDALYFSRSPIPHARDADGDAWLAHGPYYKHVGLYVFRSAFLQECASLPPSPLERVEKLEQLRVLESGHKIRVAVTSFESYPVDTIEDLEKVRAILTKGER